MLNTIMDNENTSFANISISFLRSCSQECCENDLRKGIEILAKFVFSFSIIVFNIMKLLVIIFLMKLIAQINIFKQRHSYAGIAVNDFVKRTQAITASTIHGLGGSFHRSCYKEYWNKDKLVRATHCVKSVQIRSFLWSVFSRIRSEYGDLRSKTPY